MFITQTYKYRKDNVVYVGGVLPEGSEVLTTMNILNAEDGKVLKLKDTEETLGNSLWLREGDSQDRYEEVAVTRETP